MTIENFNCRRKSVDRRNKGTSLFSKYTFWGERRHNRRQNDRSQGYYVDKPHQEIIGLVFAIGALCVLDAVLTLYHIDNGASEANPIMNYFLSKGTLYFLFFKALITIPGLVVLLQHQNFARMRIVINLIAYLYLFVVLYHLVLFVFYA
ncbi:MAG: hypothetical protein HZA78_05635 [Candidatus Schekmanbacteria bacterium]|nr:hypothetical protein [Candidatus Schekmanbacteria bacterium]